MIGGSGILFFGLPEGVIERFKEPDYRIVSELFPGEPRFPAFESRYRVDKIERIAVSQGNGRPFMVDVAHYRNSSGMSRQAQIFLSEDSGVSSLDSPLADLNRLRWDAWIETNAFLAGSTPDEKLIVSWWDNAQRIDLLSGAKTLVDSPPAESFERRSRDFWNRVSGGFASRSEPLRRLANWLLSDADQSLEAIDQTFDGGRELYFLVTLDDLARLSEMGALSKKATPYETRVFRSEQNIHRLIAKVKRWAKEKGGGSYLVHHLGASGVRVWRITTKEGEKTLLARLLPFTSSLANPLEGFDLLYRSDWSAYISIYRRKVSRAKPARESEHR